MMKPGEINLTKFLRSRMCTYLLIGGALAAGWISRPASGQSLTWCGDSGFFRGIGSLLSLSEDLGLRGAVNAVLLMGALFLMGIVNRQYMVTRTNSLIYIGLSAWLACSPAAMLFAAPGAWLLPVVMMSVLLVVYGAYDRPKLTAHWFLAMFLPAACSAVEWTFAPLMLVVLVGCAQMRCLSLRSILAMGIGMLTPVWLLWGFGLMPWHDFAWPDIVPLWRDWHLRGGLALVVLAGLTVVWAVVLMLFNLFHMIGLNARTRAINGVLTMCTIVTSVMCVAEWGRIEMYLPLLLMLTAMQTTLFFRINQGKRRGYGVVVGEILVYATFFAWSLWQNRPL